jgi:hypothetical protein
MLILLIYQKRRPHVSRPTILVGSCFGARRRKLAVFMKMNRGRKESQKWMEIRERTSLL